MMGGIFHLTLVLVLAPCVSSHQDYAREGNKWSLECQFKGDLVFWVLEGGDEAFGPKYSSEEVMVFSNGTLIFKSVKVEHEGMHTCITKHEEKFNVNRVPMKVRPLPSEYLWESEYKSRFVIGFIAALVLGLIMVSIGILIRFHYNERYPMKERLTESEVKAYNNPALDMENDVPDVECVKM